MAKSPEFEGINTQTQKTYNYKKDKSEFNIKKYYNQNCRGQIQTIGSSNRKVNHHIKVILYKIISNFSAEMQ